MNYYYDIYVNFNELPYDFYEWQQNDPIEHLKKVPLLRVDSKTLNDFILFRPIVDSEFLKNIYNKCEDYDGKKLQYILILADTKSSLAFEFDDKGNIINKSKLLLDDDLNISEIINSLKKNNLEYTLIKEKNIFPKMTRQEIEVMKFLEVELDTLYQNKTLEKLKYLYFEWLNKNNENIEDIYHDLKSLLKKGIDENAFKIYELIKMSYSTKNN